MILLGWFSLFWGCLLFKRKERNESGSYLIEPGPIFNQKILFENIFTEKMGLPDLTKLVSNGGRTPNSTSGGQIWRWNQGQMLNSTSLKWIDSTSLNGFDLWRSNPKKIQVLLQASFRLLKWIDSSSLNGFDLL